MRLTVVICTRNRSELLRQTLGALARVGVPAGVEWELLIVDNGSTDDTEAVIASWSGRLPVRALLEPNPGKSHALNRAVREASGDYILFTDDDVLVDPDWLRGYCDAFRKRPGAAVFGGPIAPWFDGDPPTWLVRTFHQVEYAFAALDLGPEPLRFGGNTVPFGANMAMRAEEQRRHRYDPRLGPRPGSGLRGEEITLIKGLLKEGAEGWWVPEAKVRHYIPRDRQTRAYLRTWYRGWGAYIARTEAPTPGRTLLRRPLWLWRDVVEGELRYLISRLFAPAEVWIEALKRASIAQGSFADHP